jgi:tetratricopeptide (TPR) repeat protein
MLHMERKDSERALEYSRRAVESGSDDAEIFANHACLLLAAGNLDEGLRFIDRAETLSPPTSVQLEIAFYRYAHDPDPEHRDAGLRAAKRLLEEGIRSAGWLLDRNVEQAERSSHPAQPLLATLALVVSDEQPISGLASFEAWQAT